jgi:hypothetical protein
VIVQLGLATKLNATFAGGSAAIVGPLDDAVSLVFGQSGQED